MFSIYMCSFAHVPSKMTKKLARAKLESLKALLAKGSSIRAIAKQLDISKSVVHNYSKGLNRNIIKKGRPKKLSPPNVAYCVTQISRGVAKTATELCQALKKDSGVNVHRTTVARALKRKGLRSGEKKEKPMLRMKNVKERLKFAQAHKDWTVEDWRTVIFSDETKINRFNSDGREWCWYREEESLIPRNVKQTVKHGGGNIKIWGCMTSFGVGFMCQIVDILDQHLYIDILKGELASTIEHYGLDETKITFQHDNDPKHTAKKVKEYLSDQTYETMSWPAQSPDLNPIEHLWSQLKRDLNKYEKPPSGLKDLWERVQVVWEAISVETCQNLIDSMPRRIQAVIKAKGYWTKY